MLPPEVAARIEEVRQRLRESPFDAPTATELVGLELTPPILAAAVRAGLLVNVGDGVYLGPEARRDAVSRLATLEQPFTTSQARSALQTSRRVVVPLLRWLDADSVTLRHPDDRRELRRGELNHQV